METSTFDKVIGYTISTDKPVAFLYICYNHLERHMKKIIPNHSYNKDMTYLEENITKR
jgi:hypothetical protein